MLIISITITIVVEDDEVEVVQGDIPCSFAVNQIPISDDLLDYYVSLVGMNGVTLYLYHAKSVDEDLGYSSLSFKQICNWARISRDTLTRLNKVLVRYGLLEIQNDGRGMTNRYYVKKPRLKEDITTVGKDGVTVVVNAWNDLQNLQTLVSLSDRQEKVLYKLVDLVLGQQRPAGDRIPEHQDHLNGLKMELLNSDPQCYVCWRQKMDFVLHHKHYDTWGSESLDDVVLLCRSCHTRVTYLSKKDPVVNNYEPTPLPTNQTEATK